MIRIYCIALFIIKITTMQAQHDSFRLWAGDAPLAKGKSEADVPMLFAYPAPPEIATGVGVIICPGGGYGRLSMEKEGREAALWLNTLGISAFVLKYRLGSNSYQHPAPLQDVQRAMLLVRHKSSQWKLDTAKIGVLGFSAGGHLASTLGTHFDKLYYQPNDEIDKANHLRPNFMLLIYPVISMQEVNAHTGSRKNLLGENPTQELKDLLSNEMQVTAQTPPTFLTHACDDATVPVGNSISFFTALRTYKIPAEMHIYPYGGHGYGMRRHLGVHTEWYKHAEIWFKTMGIIK